MVHSILQHLVSNAVKHTPNEGKIIVNAKKLDDMILVRVKDNGTGMSKEIQEKIFKPQVANISKIVNENKGAGIGLLLVKGFVEKIGGEVCFESTENKGSTFCFTLPVEKKSEPTKVELEESA